MSAQPKKSKVLYSAGLAGMFVLAAAFTSPPQVSFLPDDALMAIDSDGPTFMNMERPDPVSLLTPVQPPDRRFPLP